jgi:DNA-binding transcriptional ArsR family regulator
LRLLKERRLVKSHRRGRNVIYTLYDRHVSQVIADTLEHVREEA